MTWTEIRAAIFACILLSLPLTSVAQGTPNPENGDTSAIKQDVADFTDAYNSHDAHACAAHFLEDADFINVQGVATHGRSAIEEHWPALFAGRLKEAHRTVSVRNVRYLTPDVASMSADWELTNSRLTDGGPIIPIRKGLYDWILVKRNGRWLIAIFHESDLPVVQSK